MKIRIIQVRSSETTQQRERRPKNVRISTVRSRRTLHADLNLGAFGWLFVIILTAYFAFNPKGLWEEYKDYMSEDILHRLCSANQNPGIQFTPNVYNKALILIEDICLVIASKVLLPLGMLAPDRPANDLFDRDLQ